MSNVIYIDFEDDEPEDIFTLHVGQFKDGSLIFSIHDTPFLDELEKEDIAEKLEIILELLKM